GSAAAAAAKSARLYWCCRAAATRRRRNTKEMPRRAARRTGPPGSRSAHARAAFPERSSRLLVEQLATPEPEHDEQRDGRDRETEPLHGVAEVSLRSHVGARLPRTLVAVRLIRIEQHETRQHFAIERAFDGCLLGIVQDARPFVVTAGCRCKAHAGTRHDAKLARHRPHAFPYRYIRKVGARCPGASPAAIDEHPAALLELERRDHAIAWLTHRRRHAVEQNLVSAVVAAACADPPQHGDGRRGTRGR